MAAMRKPFFRITARCDNPRCDTDGFVGDRKKITKISAAGRPYQIERLVCPDCRCLGFVTSIEEIRKGA